MKNLIFFVVPFSFFFLYDGLSLSSERLSENGRWKNWLFWWHTSALMRVKILQTLHVSPILTDNGPINGKFSCFCSQKVISNCLDDAKLYNGNIGEGQCSSMMFVNVWRSSGNFNFFQLLKIKQFEHNFTIFKFFK